MKYGCDKEGKYIPVRYRWERKIVEYWQYNHSIRRVSQTFECQMETVETILMAWGFDPYLPAVHSRNKQPE
jgi:hypothetical protein